MISSEKAITLEERKKISYDILCYVDKWCKEHDVKYYMAYGTLLGAVRHEGFIPWDDDIDLIMFRDDYTKFINDFNNFCDARYKCLAFENRTFYLPYAKVVDTNTMLISENFIKIDDMGIGIDIFPFDYISDDKQKDKIYFDLKLLRYSLYNNAQEIIGEKKISPKLIFYWFAKLVGWKRWAKIIQDKTKKMFSESQKCCFSVGALATGGKNIYEVEWFDGTVDLKFNSENFPCPMEYAEFLKRCYGDYMKLPPVESRIAHLDKAFYK